MHFHPKDTVEAFKPGNKEKISHLWYHLHYNQMHKVKGEYKAKKDVPAPFISKELIQLSKNAESQRMQALAALNGQYVIRQLRATALSQIIHGLGSGNVLEDSLTLHPVYGIPYIPASSVKGVVRNWFVEAYCDGQEEKLPETEWGAFVFGTQQKRGAVQFYDILLYDGLKIEKDVLTVHFKYYYTNNKAATDDQNPNPVSFWNVGIKEANIFITMGRKDASRIGLSANTIMDAVVSWVERAFTEFGIGSKTSLGYGLFSEVRDVTEAELGKVLEEQQQRKEQRKKEELLKIEQEQALREQQEAEARLAAMSKEERLLFAIQSLTESQADLEKSKSELYEEVIAQQNQEAALALRQYWEKTGQWRVNKKKKKQYDKVLSIKKLLNIE